MGEIKFIRTFISIILKMENFLSFSKTKNAETKI
jgi:hypothetical protein